MSEFQKWLLKRDETFRIFPSDAGDDTPPLETPGALPAYSQNDKPPTSLRKIATRKKNCNCGK